MISVQTRARGRKRSWLALASFGLIAAPVGCERRDCEQERRHCEGTAIVSCVSPCSDVGCHRTWEYEQCESACVQSESGFPFCASSSVRDPNCVAQHSCGPDGPIECRDGYRISEQRCDAGTQCVALNEVALCAVGDVPDPRCSASAIPGPTCTGNSLLRCTLGFAVEEVSCAHGCVAGVGCVLSDTKDPRCAQSLTGASQFDYCEGATTRVSCLDGYRIKATPCDCFEYERGTYCR